MKSKIINAFTPPPEYPFAPEGFYVKGMFAVAVVLLGCILASFGQSKNPVSDTVKEILANRQKNIVAAIEAMPADKFNYKPTADQMTFGHLAAHIVEANNLFCAKAADVAEPKTEVKETDGKDKLVAAVKSSFDFCTTSLAKTDDSKLSDTIEAFGGKKEPRAWAFIAIASSLADHYGAAAMYLRLNGILPPTAQKK